MANLKDLVVNGNTRLIGNVNAVSISATSFSGALSGTATNANSLGGSAASLWAKKTDIPSYVTSAGYATNTGSATNAGSASKTGSAASAGYAGTIGTATNANSLGGSAASLWAKKTDIPSYVTSAGYATNTGSATSTGSVTTIGYATSAGYASAIPATLPDVTTAGTVGPSAAATFTAGIVRNNIGTILSTKGAGSIVIPYFTVDAKGRVTAYGTRSLSMTNGTATTYTNYGNYGNYGNYEDIHD